jgi:hypothetical protein
VIEPEPLRLLEVMLLPVTLLKLKLGLADNVKEISEPEFNVPLVTNVNVNVTFVAVASLVLSAADNELRLLAAAEADCQGDKPITVKMATRVNATIIRTLEKCMIPPYIDDVEKNNMLVV